MEDALGARLLTPSATGTPDRTAIQVADKAGSGTGGNASRLREAAKEFEALFLGYMLNVMRETVEESGLTDKGLGQSVYTELFDQELARTLSGRGALGIADLLIRKLSDRSPFAESPAVHEAVRARPSGSGAAVPGGEDEEVPDFRMPVQAQFSSSFGIRKDPFTHVMRFHHGVDIAAPEGMKIRAAYAGRVVFSGFEKGFGNTVVVHHPGGFETRYAHLGQLLVSAGDSLQTEQVLGTVGSTGHSTGPHLHFEVSRYGETVDPKALLTG